MKINYAAFSKAVQTWQKDNGNTCSVCHANNIQTQCHACGWWGKVPPLGTKLVSPAPELKYFTLSADSMSMKDYGFNPLGNGQWELIPSGKIVDLAGLQEFKAQRKQKPVRNDCLGLSWDEIEAKQGGKLKRKP